VDRWTCEYGSNATQQICKFNQAVPEISVRIYDATAQSELATAGVQLNPGRILTSAGRVGCGDIAGAASFKDGRVAIQDEGSQLVAMLLGKGERILDCCAAPGGKTRLIAKENPNASIIALELHDHRAQLLRKRVAEKNVQVLTADVTKFTSDHVFDRVLVDAPCSGTGTLAHNPEIKWRLKSEDLADLHVRQRAILQSAMKLTAPGGRLIYATCSLEQEENVSVVKQSVSEDSSFCPIDCRTVLESLRKNGDLAWNDLDSMLNGPYLRTIPGVHPCDGFFAAILEKK
jgi:16S rRNA (cytosine967-C5)-methyltransferase